MTNKQEKRARQKAFRDQRRAAELAAYRRQRMMRTGGILLIVAVLAIAIGSSLAGGNDDEESREPGAEATASPSPTPTAAAPSGEVACGGAKPPEAKPKQYDKPKQVLEEGVDYSAVISTSCGKIKIDLLEKDAPETVNSVVFLAQEGYFDGLLWHRVERGSVIQTGDPNGLNGVEPDGPGYSIPDELPKGSDNYDLGTVAMANAGPNTGGSQFFIVTRTSGPATLPNAYSIFGETDESSFAVLAKLNKLKTQEGNDPTTTSMPVNPAYINSITIVES